jgi:nitrite reductase/ring-hydroxylating ferredoxin subunit
MPTALPESLAYWSVQPLNLFHHAWKAGDSMAASTTHHCALWFLLSGSVTVQSGEQRWTARAGEVLLLSPLRQRLKTYPVRQEGELLWVQLS